MGNLSGGGGIGDKVCSDLFIIFRGGVGLVVGFSLLVSRVNIKGCLVEGCEGELSRLSFVLLGTKGEVVEDVELDILRKGFYLILFLLRNVSNDIYRIKLDSFWMSTTFN